MTFAPGTQPSAHHQQHADEPHFIPVGPQKRWGWTPWIVLLLGAAIVWSVVAFLVFEDDIWLMALGIPAIVLLGLLTCVWVVLSGKTQQPEDDEAPSG